MNNIMLDLETLGKGSNAAIAAIGAVFFEPETGEVAARFYQTIELSSAMKYGKIDASTIQWWMKQDDEARALFSEPDSMSVEEALLHFAGWISQVKKYHELKVWGNGATFDNVILENAFNAIGQDVPWPFYGNRDVRTIVDLGRKLRGINPKKDFSFEGTQHNALDDAIHQARYVSEIYQSLK